MKVLALAFGVAAFNVMLGRRLGLGVFGRGGRSRAAFQSLAVASRVSLIFLGAHLLWRAEGRAFQPALFIVAVALLQLAAHAWLLRREAAR